MARRRRNARLDRIASDLADLEQPTDDRYVQAFHRTLNEVAAKLADFRGEPLTEGQAAYRDNPQLCAADSAVQRARWAAEGGPLDDSHEAVEAMRADLARRLDALRAEIAEEADDRT